MLNLFLIGLALLWLAKKKWLLPWSLELPALLSQNTSTGWWALAGTRKA